MNHFFTLQYISHAGHCIYFALRKCLLLLFLSGFVVVFVRCSINFLFTFACSTMLILAKCRKSLADPKGVGGPPSRSIFSPNFMRFFFCWKVDINSRLAPLPLELAPPSPIWEILEHGKCGFFSALDPNRKWHNFHFRNIYYKNKLNKIL